MLLCVENAFAGDNPDVEPIVREFGEGEDEHHEQISE